MAAIPVPVHFDGHNINIITEDSPSTCKSRTKGVNYGKKNNNKNKKRNNQNQNGKYGKAQLLNKRAPTANPSNKKANSSNGGDTLVVSPLPPSDEHSPSNKENIDEANQREPTLLNGIISKASDPSHNRITKPTATAPEPSPTEVIPSLPSHNNIQSPMNPVVDVTNMPHNIASTITAPPSHVVTPHVSHNVTATNHDAALNNKSVHIAKGAMNKRKPPRLPLAAPPRQRLQQNQRQQMKERHRAEREEVGMVSEDHRSGTLQQMANKQNEQLIASGLDPNEFGSHDDVGFDDGDSQNNQGKDRQNLYKTELCREWSTSGWCYYNKRCSFAHGLQELRPVFRSKKWRTKRCRNWHTTGYCPYEHRCQFLHDQSPPRRISDYATANARALVAAQQRMQPLYFHYQVDCNRDEESDEEEDHEDKPSKHNKNTGNRSKSNTPKNNAMSPLSGGNTSSVGPRLKRKDYRNNMSHTLKNGGPRQNQNHGMRGEGVNMNHVNASQVKHRAALRMVQQNKKNGPNGLNRKTMGKANKQNLKKKRNNKPRTPRSNQPNMNYDPNNKPMKNKRKKQKDAVITPFNPVSATYGATPHSYELAAQQLGIYNAAASQIIPTQNPGQHIAIPGIGALPPLPFQGLPPSIDPSIYLSLTPSPPHSPVAVKEMIPLQLDNKLKKRGDGQHPVSTSHLGAGGLNVEVPPSLTPSPPALPVNHTIGLDPLSQQQVQMQLAKQQQTLQVLHAKVQEVAQQQAAQHAEQQATVAALLSRGVANKSATPVAPIDGGLLESLLPTDDTIPPDGIPTAKSAVNGNTLKKASDETASITNSAPKSDTRLNTHAHLKGNTKMTNPSSAPNKKPASHKALPPIPPIPPPLQLQTSINSVVTGAVAAAMTPTGVTSLVPMTPTLIDPTSNGQIFGYPGAGGRVKQTRTSTTTSVPVPVSVPVAPGATSGIAAYAPIDLQSVPSIQPPVSTLQTTQTTFQQQAHAYTSAHTQATAYHIPPPLAPSAAYNIPATAPPVSYGAPHAHYPSIPTLPGIHMQHQVAFPQFYAPSPDFQEIPQYYSTTYSQHNGLPRHHY